MRKKFTLSRREQHECDANAKRLTAVGIIPREENHSPEAKMLSIELTGGPTDSFVHAPPIGAGATLWCVGLKYTCKSKPASSLLYSWNTPATIVPGTLVLSVTKVNVFVGRTLVAAFLGASVSETVILPLPITSMCAGTFTLMVEVNRFIP